MELASSRAPGALLHQGFELPVALVQALEGIHLPVPDQMIGNGNAAVGDHPGAVFLLEQQHQPGRLPGQDMVGQRQVDMEEGRDQDHVGTDVLQRQIQHFDAQGFGHLGKVLAGDPDPFGLVLHQEITATGIAAEVFAEAGGQPVIPGGVHLDVFIKQGANESLSFWVHGQCH